MAGFALPPGRREAIFMPGATGLPSVPTQSDARARSLPGAGHMALLGDSVFDNAAYVAGDRMWRHSSGADCQPAGKRRWALRAEAMLEPILARRLPVGVYTIYDPRFPDRLRQRLAVAGPASFNDVIIRQALIHRISVLDLRLVSDEDADFANPIEPSVQGGGKIATAIAHRVSEPTCPSAL